MPTQEDIEKYNPDFIIVTDKYDSELLNDIKDKTKLIIVKINITYEEKVKTIAEGLGLNDLTDFILEK